jgi:uncharacterized membrane protein
VNIQAEEGIALFPTSAQAVGLPGDLVTYTLRVTNTLPISNSLNLTLNGESWISELSSSLVGPLGPGEGQDFSVTVQVPQSASGGESDSVIVTASSVFPGVFPVTATLTSSATNVYGLSLAPAANELTGLPGATVTHTLVLTNTGNTTDTFSISTSSEFSITITVDPETSFQGGAVTLGRDQTALISAAVSIPETALNGTSDTATLTVSSAGDPLISEDASLITNVRLYQVMLPLIPAQ